MSAEIAARLRQLAQDHHDGRLDTAAYRSLRSPLLDSLVSNVGVSAALEVTQPRSVAATGTVRALPGEKPEKSTPNARVLLALAVLLALLVVTVGAYLLLRGGRGNNNAPVAGALFSASGQPEQVVELVEPFMDRGDWSEGRLAALNASLLELGGSRIAVVAHDARFQRFVDELRARLKEQQALSPAPLTADNSPLAALAVTVGIDLNSPDAALHITALPPPVLAPPESAPAVAQRPSAPHRVANQISTAASGAAAAKPFPAPASVVPPIPAAALGTNALARETSPAAVQPSSPTAAVDSHEGACRLDLIRSRRPVCHDLLPGGADGPVLALIPAGAFEMGSTASPHEQPVHHVTIRKPFAISVYEISQGEFRQYCEQTKRQCAPQPWAGDDYPVVNVSWDDARSYTAWLSATTHHHYSLPTEAQWEYAARAGNSGSFPSGDALSPTDAQFSASTKQTSAARRSQTFNANAFRLLHTVGNVREWVEDTWTQSFAGAPDDGSAVNSAQTTSHVVRGGSYADGAARLRLSLRESLPLNTRDVTTGFRIVRELP